MFLQLLRLYISLVIYTVLCFFDVCWSSLCLPRWIPKKNAYQVYIGVTVYLIGWWMTDGVMKWCHFITHWCVFFGVAVCFVLFCVVCLIWFCIVYGAQLILYACACVFAWLNVFPNSLRTPCPDIHESHKLSHNTSAIWEITRYRIILQNRVFLNGQIPKCCLWVWGKLPVLDDVRIPSPALISWCMLCLMMLQGNIQP